MGVKRKRRFVIIARKEIWLVSSART
jgi:hypothetical protein